MAHIDQELHELLENLKTQRDDLRVRLHLAKVEAKDEWERLEHKWENLGNRMEAAKREVGRTTGDVAAALRLAAEELRKGYQQLRTLL
jgi:hypothetical protein